MFENDALDYLLKKEPNGPATNAGLLLLRQETQYGFATLGTEMSHLRLEMTQRMDRMEKDISQLKENAGQINRSLELLAQQVALILQRLQ